MVGTNADKHFYTSKQKESMHKIKVKIHTSLTSVSDTLGKVFHTFDTNLHSDQPNFLILQFLSLKSTLLLDTSVRWKALDRQLAVPTCLFSQSFYSI